MYFFKERLEEIDNFMKGKSTKISHTHSMGLNISNSAEGVNLANKVKMNA